MDRSEGRLAGQSAVVTGAGRGIGRILALTLAEEGAKVTVSGRNERNLDAVAGEIRSAGGEAAAIRCDVTKWEQVESLAKGAAEAHGTIAILVNNAGIPSSTALLVDVEEEEWEAVLETNVKGVFLVTKAVLPEMMKRKSGHLITVSSGAGTPSGRNSVNIPYAVSKWAVEGFTHSLALQLKEYGIRANNIAPGPTLNDFQKGRAKVERLLKFPGGMRRNEWVSDSFRYLVCESGDLTGAHVSSPEWDRENGITREPVPESEIRAFMTS